MPPYYFDIRPIRLGSDRWRWDGNESGKFLFEADGFVESAVALEWELITPSSPERLRVGLERVAWWFKREMQYDSAQYTADEDTDPRDRLWVYISHREADKPVLGGAVFRYADREGENSGLFLSFVNLHPFNRRRRALSYIWSDWRDAYGNFVVAPPLSPAMGAFLRKESECWRHGAGVTCGGCPAPLY